MILFLLYLTISVNATPQNAVKAGKAGQCEYCHPDGPPALGPAGEYFKEHQTLEGYGVIGVHISQWNVAMICFGILLVILLLVYLFKV